MLMLTHAWLLKHFLGAACFNEKNQDLYVYNICPDFLPIRKEFTSEKTHGISRFGELTAEHKKAAFIHFHLMVDDIAHHGVIDKVPVKTFNPDSRGYTYIKGKPLMQPLADLYLKRGKPIDSSVSAYRSHMIIEMMFDLSLYRALPEESNRLLELMCDALQQMTRKDNADEFAETVGWIYNVHPQDAAEALKQCADVYTIRRMNSFMSLEGRIKVFINKFGLEPADGQTYSILENIMTLGMNLVGNYEEFLDPTLEAIRKVGFNPLI